MEIYDLQNGVRNFFKKINRSQDIQVSVTLRFRRIALHNKIINKTRPTKHQENSAHHFGGNYLTNYLVKFLQDRLNPEELELLKYALVITGFLFLQKIVSEGFLTPFNFSRSSC